MPKIYVDGNSSSQTIFGISGPFKVNPSALPVKRNRKTTLLHLGKVKPEMVTVLGVFSSAINGTRFSGGEFTYQDPSQTLLIQSVSGIPGIVPGVGYAIPISYISNEDRVACTNLYPIPVYLSGA